MSEIMHTEQSKRLLEAAIPIFTDREVALSPGYGDENIVITITSKDGKRTRVAYETAVLSGIGTDELVASLERIRDR